MQILIEPGLKNLFQLKPGLASIGKYIVLSTPPKLNYSRFLPKFPELSHYMAHDIVQRRTSIAI